MKGTLRFVLYALLLIILAIGGILIYQAFFISDDGGYGEIDQDEINQKLDIESTTDSLFNNIDFGEVTDSADTQTDSI